MHRGSGTRWEDAGGAGPETGRGTEPGWRMHTGAEGSARWMAAANQQLPKAEQGWGSWQPVEPWHWELQGHPQIPALTHPTLAAARGTAPHLSWRAPPPAAPGWCPWVLAGRCYAGWRLRHAGPGGQRTPLQLLTEASLLCAGLAGSSVLTGL